MNADVAPTGEPSFDVYDHADDGIGNAPDVDYASNEFVPDANVPETVNFVAFGSENGPFTTNLSPEELSSESTSFGAFADFKDIGPLESPVLPKIGTDMADDIPRVSENRAPDKAETGLARVDPLTIRPRPSSCILAFMLSLAFFACAAGIYWFGVHTIDGQSFDEIVWNAVVDDTPTWLDTVSHTLGIRWVIPAISLTTAAIAFMVAAIRKRWLLLGQMAVFGVLVYAATWLKMLLPRPMLMNISSSPNNTAPSGHTLLAVGCGLVLLVAVPRVWRAIVALVESTYCGFVAISLIICHWHRPSDVLMSLLICGGLMMLALVFTRQSGMDSLGSRISSASIQIVGSVMITFGIISCLYASYMLWQVYPGLGVAALWVKNGAYSVMVTAIIGVSCLTFGLTLALRQITASPLTRLGLVGAPPAPPEKQR
ncbi:Membrane-associated phospholipid phosphatase [Bifidobacterium commune]|uniref:Membrane-associated phospholipid phosphatase n=1 Tax=Bifidobacterium commune TaxID=1505727 RepID=A0A1C4H7K9_9BIFI|nr:Membrane-associated phospholipid phosphatase [Bifidobacterium commune]